MMKKNFSKYFMIAAVAVTMGFVSSCKDYEDEMVAEFRGGDVALQGSIDNLKSDLEKGLADAKTEREALEQELTDEINEVKELYATKAELEAAKNEHDADVEALETKIAGVNTDLQAAKANLETTIGRLTAAETKITTLETAITELKNKDTEIENSIKTLKETLAKEQATQDQKIKALEDVVLLINSDIAALQGRADSLASVAAAHDKAIADVNNLIGELEAEHAAECDSLSGVLDDVQKKMKTLASKADVKKLLDGLEEDLTEALENEIAGVEETMNDLFNNVLAATQANSALITKLQEVYEAHAAETAAKIAGLEAADMKLDNKIDSLDQVLDGAITDLEGAIAAVEEKMQNQIDSLRNDLDSLEARVAANEEAIEELANRVTDLEDALDKRISGVLVQGVYSPVIGYFNMPLGVKSNILAGYKGEFTVGESINFPFATSEYWLDGQINPLTSLQSALGGGETITEIGDGYAGKLYLTINPAEVNLDGVEFALVNSANEVAPVELATPVVTSDVLKFGYTRAGAALYEAKATITDYSKASFDLNLSDYKDILNDLKGGNVNLADIARTLSSTINGFADANAVRASWTDSLGEHTVYSDFAVAAVAVKPLSFNFMYGVNDVKNTSGVTRVHNFIDKSFKLVNDKLASAIPSLEGLNFTAPEIKKIELKSFDEFKETVDLDIVITDTVKFDFVLDTIIVIADKEIADKIVSTGEFKTSVTIPAQTVPVNGDSTQTVTVPAQTQDITVPSKDITVKGDTIEIEDFKLNITKHIEHPFTVTYSMEEIVKSIYGEITTPIEGVNDMLGELEAFMDNVNGMLAELKKVQNLETSLKNAMNDVKGQLHSYLDKFNTKLCNAINSFNDKLQPAMFAKTTSGFGVLSQSKSMPTVIENGTVLVPTSYTAELLAPAFKKYVAITAVDGSTANLAAVNTGDLNKVLDGSVSAVKFNGESGKTYEITYAALDYAGIASSVKYYVTVK